MNTPEKISTAWLTSSLGALAIRGTESFIHSVSFFDEAGDDKFPSELVKECRLQLEEYFNGERTIFNLPLRQEGTPFQQSVWHELSLIPFGSTISYLALARRLNNEKAIRAVGSCNGKNKIAIILPCHRVIGSDNKLTGYAGGLWRKEWLLKHEQKFTTGLRTLF